MPTPDLLDERAVSEIEAIPETAHFNLWGKFQGQFALLTVAQRDALCATVKHLRAERIRLLDLVRYCRHQLHEEGLITTDDLAALVEAGPESARRLESYDDLQSQLEQLRATLAQVEQERDTARESVTWITTEKQKVEQKLSGAIHLCKDKAADYEKDPTTAHVLRAIARRLEKL